MNKKILEKKKIELINEFISNTKNFWKEDKKLIDKKHLNILLKFEKKYKGNINLYSKELIDWEGQTNLGSPFQLNFRKLKYLGLSQTIKHVLQNIKSSRLSNYFNKSSFIDDLEIIKQNNGFEIFRKIPLHEKTDFKDFFFIEKNISTNHRWNRYIYLASQIKKKKLITKKKNNWLDIGSYYGGLQMLVKSYNKDGNFFLLDFNHQLCRSYVYLKNLYPNSYHFLPNQINENIKIKKNSFFYVPVKKFYLLKKIKFDLVSNFFSFGEMKKETFYNYFDHEIISKSISIYLVNRFVSSPFFEPTYQNTLNVFDYEKKKL